ncbi:ferredoxin [Nocardioides sp. WS12]|uniref:ferredoxin n=1 Tax=Nocardioides sp. WS12 TaxID=2486272 RepID=UPI0015FD8CDE|nr:ferredoxin [Nocardioides sp. WS12]
MKISVHEDECEGNAMCMAIAPDIFDVDDDGMLELLQAEPAADRRSDVERAVRSCPKAALSVTSD